MQLGIVNKLGICNVEGYDIDDWASGLKYSMKNKPSLVLFRFKGGIIQRVTNPYHVE